MGAGKPDYNRLAQLGQLPKHSLDKVPGFKRAVDAEKKIEDIKKQLCDECKNKIFGDENKKSTSEKLSEKCPVEGCEYVAEGTELQIKNRLRLHAKTHETKE